MVYDSSALAPLPGARVTLLTPDGLREAAETATDGRGRFHFPVVEAGDRRLILSHPRLAELGLTPLLASHAVVSGEEAVVTLGLPSLATLWPLYCPDDPYPGTGPAAAEDPDAPMGRGVLFGRVLDAVTGVPQPVLEVEARWRDISGRRGRARDRTDGSGSFTLCGVPPGAVVTLSTDFAGEIVFEERVQLQSAPVQARELKVVLGRPGTVQGRVSDAASGAPIEAAVVTLAGTEHRGVTGRNGEFRFTGLEQGVYLLQLEHLAYGRQTRELVLGSRTLQVDVRFSQEAVTLEGVTVTVLNPRLEDEGFYQRRRRHAATPATHLTADELLARSATSLPWALRNIEHTELRMAGPDGPALIFRRRDAPPCTLPVYLDGVPLMGAFSLGNLRPDEVLAVEVYPPPPIGPPLPAELRRIGVPGCGAVLIWTR
ncbi:MAG: carboxypeptidase regulatory-like domain-containing protein [Longimicrobiales bacterium]|nr:carboxypeptidase regulatory-like domain-containing protein [Longimicrobiales bacterium]